MSNSNFERKNFGKTRPSTEVEITKEENEKICGRVARLAALYKGNVKFEFCSIFLFAYYQ